MLTFKFLSLGDGGNRVNVCLRPKENRMLKTGLHVVADIYCNCCLQILGWKYVGGVFVKSYCRLCNSLDIENGGFANF